MVHWRRRSAGFSLVEMISALFIFSVAVVATLEVLTACLRAVGASEGYTRATLLAQGLMEETLAEDLIVAGEESGDFDERFPGAEWVRVVSETETASLYEVQVKVSWPDRGRQREFQLTTLAAERK